MFLDVIRTFCEGCRIAATLPFIYSPLSCEMRYKNHPRRGCLSVVVGEIHARPYPTEMEPLTRFRFKWFCEHVRLVGKRKREKDSAVLVFAGCQWVTSGLALGIEAEMDGGLQGSKSPLTPLKGGIIQVLWPVSAGHCSGKPDGAAAL